MKNKLNPNSPDKIYQDLIHILTMVYLSDVLSFRYKMFDLGKLLIRYDSNGSRHEVFKRELNNILIEKLDLYFGSRPELGELPFASMQSWLGSMHFSMHEDLKKLGLSTFDIDQHPYYLEKLVHYITKSQKSIESQLSNKIAEENSLTWTFFNDVSGYEEIFNTSKTWNLELKDIIGEK